MKLSIHTPCIEFGILNGLMKKSLFCGGNLSGMIMQRWLSATPFGRAVVKRTHDCIIVEQILSRRLIVCFSSLF